jgi:hypothetical protein
MTRSKREAFLYGVAMAAVRQVGEKRDRLGGVDIMVEGRMYWGRTEREAEAKARRRPRR